MKNIHALKTATVFGIALILGACASQPAQVDPIQEHLSYLPAQQLLIKNQKKVPQWLKEDATVSAYEAVNVSGMPYTLGVVCKQHDCGNNRFFMLFNPDKTAEVGLLVTVKNTPKAIENPQKYASFRKFGKGSPEIKRYLLDKSVEGWK